MMDVFSDADVTKLLDYALSARNVCVRHSFVCLIQDFLEVESSCVRRRVSLTACKNVVPSLCMPMFASASADSSSSAVDGSGNLTLASSSSVPSFPVFTVSNEGKLESNKDFPLSPPSASSTLDLDSNDIPDTPTGAQQMIENLVSAAEPEELKSFKMEIDKEKRRKELKIM